MKVRFFGCANVQPEVHSGILASKKHNNNGEVSVDSISLFAQNFTQKQLLFENSLFTRDTMSNNSSTPLVNMQNMCHILLIESTVKENIS